MPKSTRSTRSKASKSSKSGKNAALTRGRVPKKDASLVSVSSSDNDEFEKNISDCSVDSKSSTSTASSMPEEAKTKKPTPSSSRSLEELTTESEKESDDGTMEKEKEQPDKENLTDDSGDTEEEDDEEWKNLPSFLDGNSTPGQKFQYLTKDIRFREFELNQRKELVRMKEDIETFRANSESALKVMRSLCPEVKNGKVREIVKLLGFPTSLKDLVLRLMSLETPLNTDPNLQPATASASNSDNPQDYTVYFTPMTLPIKSHLQATSSKKFPSPAKMAKFATPKKNQQIYQFHGQKTLSTNKAPRMPKPGEVFYSKSGSPILQRRILPADSHAQERIEINEPDGTKIEVDVVFRGNNDPNKLRVFQEVARDFRHVIATRSTVKHNRVLPPRINQKAQSATKKKPEWR